MAAEKIKGRACWKCAREPSLKKAWDCEPQTDPVHVLFAGTDHQITLYRCAMFYVTPEVAQIFSSYYHYREGHWLPYSGGLWDQPHLLVECWRILDRYFAELKVDA